MFNWIHNTLILKLSIAMPNEQKRKIYTLSNVKTLNSLTNIFVK